MPDRSPLFIPFTLNRLALIDRWVMPAMRRGMGVAGSTTAELAACYGRRAEGGVGLIIGESGAVTGVQGCCVRLSIEVS